MLADHTQAVPEAGLWKERCTKRTACKAIADYVNGLSAIRARAGVRSEIAHFQDRAEMPSSRRQLYYGLISQSFLATHNSVIPARPSIRQWEQEPVLLARVIALLVVMGHVLLQGSAQRPLPEQDELRQAFLFHRSHPAFRIGVQFRIPV